MLLYACVEWKLECRVVCQLARVVRISLLRLFRGNFLLPCGARLAILGYSVNEQCGVDRIRDNFADAQASVEQASTRDYRTMSRTIITHGNNRWSGSMLLFGGEALHYLRGITIGILSYLSRRVASPPLAAGVRAKYVRTRRRKGGRLLIFNGFSSHRLSQGGFGTLTTSSTSVCIGQAHWLSRIRSWIYASFLINFCETGVVKQS